VKIGGKAKIDGAYVPLGTDLLRRARERGNAVVDEAPRRAVPEGRRPE